MFGLPTGDYAVRVIALGYAREYYDNVTASCDAKIVHVTAFREASGIDFKLTEGGSISGHVYQSDGVTPIAGAEVWVRPSKYNADQGFWARTGSDGSYTVENLSLGTFKVTAEAKGYASAKHYHDVYGWNNAMDVVVTPPGDTSGVDFRLDLASSISGFVYASNGVTPIPNVPVIADSPTGFIEGFGGSSGKDGSYIIEGIPPGKYSLRIQAETGWYAGEFYDAKYTCGTADFVDVSAGKNTPNINFTLDEGGAITGHVFDQDTGEPLTQIGLFVCLPNGDCCVTPFPTISSDGSYRAVLKPGAYLIRIGPEAWNLYGYKYVPEWYDNVYDMSKAALVSVALHQEISGIDFYLAKSGSISGHVYDEDGDPVSDASVYAFSDVYPGNGANTQADGSYTIEGLLSGDYVVQVTVSGYVSEFYNDVTDQGSATKVVVNAPDNTPGIDFHLIRASR